MTQIRETLWRHRGVRGRRPGGGHRRTLLIVDGEVVRSELPHQRRRAPTAALMALLPAPSFDIKAKGWLCLGKSENKGRWDCFAVAEDARPGVPLVLLLSLPTLSLPHRTGACVEGPASTRVLPTSPVVSVPISARMACCDPGGRKENEGGTGKVPRTGN